MQQMEVDHCFYCQNKALRTTEEEVYGDDLHKRGGCYYHNVFGLNEYLTTSLTFVTTESDIRVLV